jgi:hypothetical protein
VRLRPALSSPMGRSARPRPPRTGRKRPRGGQWLGVPIRCEKFRYSDLRRPSGRQCDHLTPRLAQVLEEAQKTTTEELVHERETRRKQAPGGTAGGPSGRVPTGGGRVSPWPRTAAGLWGPPMGRGPQAQDGCEPATRSPPAVRTISTPQALRAPLHQERQDCPRHRHPGARALRQILQFDYRSRPVALSAGAFAS